MEKYDFGKNEYVNQKLKIGCYITHVEDNESGFAALSLCLFTEDGFLFVRLTLLKELLSNVAQYDYLNVESLYTRLKGKGFFTGKCCAQLAANSFHCPIVLLNENEDVDDVTYLPSTCSYNRNNAPLILLSTIDDPYKFQAVTTHFLVKYPPIDPTSYELLKKQGDENWMKNLPIKPNK